jgi:hypothetical protein
MYIIYLYTEREHARQKERKRDRERKTNPSIIHYIA